MSIVEKLDSLRAAAPGCSLAAFGDLNTRLVLRTSAARPWPQERLDELCMQAARCFASADSPGVAEHFLDEGERIDQAILLEPSEVRLFLRAPEEESDLLCVVCHSVGDFERVERLARDTVRTL